MILSYYDINNTGFTFSKYQNKEIVCLISQWLKEDKDINHPLTNYFNYPKNWLNAAKGSPGHKGYLIEADQSNGRQEVIGIIDMQLNTATKNWACFIYLSPDRRRNKYGSNVFSFIKEELKSLGYSGKIFIYCLPNDEVSEKFLIYNGFEVYSDDGNYRLYTYWLKNSVLDS